LKDVEGPLPVSKDVVNKSKERWAGVVYPLINELEANGITWEWVNDESIQNAQLTTDKTIDIRGNKYQVLVLAEDSVIKLKTAQKIKLLASAGMRLAGTGTLPYLQPSYLNWKENDKSTNQLIKSAFALSSSHYSVDINDLVKWIGNFRRPVRFSGEFHFTKQIEREMSDGSRLQFIWNKSDQWQTIALTLDQKYKRSYWLNADTGTVIKNNKSLVSYRMAPYSSIILYASTRSSAPLVSGKPTEVATDQGKIQKKLAKWNLKADSVEVKDTALFDWRTSARLKFSSAKGIYTSSFNWTRPAAGARYYINLGKVYYSAEVYINGRAAGKRVFAPYLFNITNLLRQGKNDIEVRVTTGQLNGFIGKGNLGDKHYKQFKNKDDQLMSAGLAGPVIISRN